MQGLLASLPPAILKLGVRRWRAPYGEVCCVMLLFYFSLSHGSRSSLKWAEWSLSPTSLLPKLHPAFKGYRSKGPSVLPVGLGNKRQRPFKREREGRESCRCEVTVSQPGPWELQPAYCRGLSMGLICGFWKRNTLLIMSNSKPPSQSLLGSQRTQTVCSPGLTGALIWIYSSPALSVQLLDLLSLISQFLHLLNADKFSESPSSFRVYSN